MIKKVISNLYHHHLNSLKPESKRLYLTWKDRFINHLHQEFTKILRNSSSSSSIINEDTVINQFKALQQSNPNTLMQIISSFFINHHNSEQNKFKSSTLWNGYAAIGCYLRLVVKYELKSEAPSIEKLLKNYQKQEETKTSSSFSNDQINNYLQQAPNDMNHLIKKVYVILGTYGLLRIGETAYLQFEDIEYDEQRNIINVALHREKQSGPKALSNYIITNNDHVNIISQYIKKFSKDQRKGRFFRYFNDKDEPTNKQIGKNTIASYPQEIASFLNLNNPSSYTGHSLRKTGATLLADSGVDVINIQRAGGWSSPNIASKYVQQSSSIKNTISSAISQQIQSTTTSSSSTTFCK
jgi:integrase